MVTNTLVNSPQVPRRRDFFEHDERRSMGDAEKAGPGSKMRSEREEEPAKGKKRGGGMRSEREEEAAPKKRGGDKQSRGNKKVWEKDVGGDKWANDLFGAAGDIDTDVSSNTAFERPRRGGRNNRRNNRKRDEEGEEATGTLNSNFFLTSICWEGPHNFTNMSVCL